MNDLALIPIDKLLAEVESRTTCFICSYEFPEEKGKMIHFRYGKGSWYTSIQLSSILSNDVLNNWNGELKTLQRINEDAEDEEDQ